MATPADKSARRSGKKGKGDGQNGQNGKSGKRGMVRDDRSKRLLDLVVMLLGADGPVPFRELREQFRASRTKLKDAGLRAFERDKADLLELGVPLRYVTPEEDDSIDEAGYVVDLRRH